MTRTDFQEKVAGYTAKATALKRKSTISLYGKLFFFILTVLFAWLCFKSPGIIHLTAAIASAVAYLATVAIDNIWQTEIEKLDRLKNVCQRELAALDGDFSAFNDGIDYNDATHAFSYDLDLFGRNSLFQRLDRTVTRKGSDRLAYRLTNLPLTAEEITRNREAVAELCADDDWRLNFLSNPGTDDDTGFSISRPEGRLRTFIMHPAFTTVSVMLTLACLLLALCALCPWRYFVAIFLFQLSVAILASRKTVKASFNATKSYQKYKSYFGILETIRQTAFKSPILAEAQRDLFGKETSCLKAFRRLATLLNLLDQRINGLMYILLNGLFLYDIQLIRAFLNWEKTYLPYFGHWMDCIAEIDALTSFANYAATHPHNAYGEIIKDGSDHVIQAAGMYHPFLNESAAVPNDFTLKKGNIAIVTGANMAGKSTFLRTVGVNYILACNGMPVCAGQFRFAIMSLFSSMRTTDNLSQNVSYFNAELLRLKQLLHYIKNNRLTLVILDEILKGTNSKDKLEGSKLFLKEMTKYPVSGIIATHDLELAELGIKKPETYRNYCFEIALAKEIHYTYKIQDGIAKNMNASYLLSNMLEENMKDE